MRCCVFSTKPYDERFLSEASANHALTFLEPRLTIETAALADGFDAACLFVNDEASADVIERLASMGVRFIVLRSAGFNNVDLDVCKQHGIRVARVPAYSPQGVAEHAVGLMLALNRRLPKAYNRVREGNFALDGLLGFQMHGKTAGVVGTGLIGAACCRILRGFGMTVLAHDPNPADGLDVEYVELDQLWAESDVITLHVPLFDATYHLVNDDTLGRMKDGVMLINTSRGGLVDTRAVIAALKSQKLGALGLDVYEEEDGLFFSDRSGDILGDDTFARLLTFPNVLITGHQAFFTREALTEIAQTTIDNLTRFEAGAEAPNEVRAD
ncbi:MAG: 2-hydroxyacid dehydrogenase [Planctomycetota bacterium]